MYDNVGFGSIMFSVAWHMLHDVRASVNQSARFLHSHARNPHGTLVAFGLLSFDLLWL